ncbi:hypothetical protein [Nocardia grenadensis]|uniref:hypothetical protein n=1 Tax=Nocardia grenadensis TaxID=931537 RepID=UPI003D93E64E
MRVAGRVSVTAASVCLPTAVRTVATATASGALSAAQAAVSEPGRVFVGDGRSAEELTVEAARDALSKASITAADLDLVLSACILETRTSWKAAPHVARLIGAENALTVGLRQMSNGGAIGAQLAIAQLLAHSGSGHALVTSGDVLDPDGHSRWRLGLLAAALCDGATGLVLTRGPGRLAVKSIVSRGWSGQEADMADTNPAVGGNGYIDAPDAPDVRSTLKLRKQIRLCVEQALTEAGSTPDLVVMPRAGTKWSQLIAGALPPIADAARQLDLTSATGHLGAGDMTANLAYLLEHNVIGRSRHAALIGVGGGFATTCLVVGPDDTNKE